jgi:hypothetical protein
MILPSSPPLEITRAYKNGVGDFVAPGGALWTLLLQRHAAHPVHCLDIEATAAVDPVPAQLADVTNYAGWRFLAAGSGLAGACHVGSTDAEVSAKMTGFSSETEIQKAVDLLGQLPNLAVVQTGSFNLQALRVPWLKFEAFWLADEGGYDFVIPYQGFPEAAGLQRYAVYPANEFLAAVQPLAKVVKGETLRTRAKRLRSRASWHVAGIAQALAEAEDLEARGQVLIDINKAESPEIERALGLTKSEAAAIAKYVGKAPIKSIDDLSNVKQIDHTKLKKHLIGFGHKRAVLPSR